MSSEPRPDGVAAGDSGQAVAINRGYWDDESDVWVADHPRHTEPDLHPSWGAWDVPERTAGVLGPVAGKTMLELGCGDAHDLIGFARQGAEVTGIELSSRQIERAADLMRRSAVEFPVIEGSVDAMPFEDAAFDIVYSDYGALDFIDPRSCMEEIVRVLRPGGMLTICTISPWVWACADGSSGAIRERLANDYFGTRGVETEKVAIFTLGYSDWIELAKRHRLQVESLVELRPSQSGLNRDHPSTDWAERWPYDQIWSFKKE